MPQPVIGQESRPDSLPPEGKDALARITSAFQFDGYNPADGFSRKGIQDTGSRPKSPAAAPSGREANPRAPAQPPEADPGPGRFEDVDLDDPLNLQKYLDGGGEIPGAGDGGGEEDTDTDDDEEEVRERKGKPEADDEDEGLPETLEDLSKALELDDGYVSGLKVSVKVDGKDVQIPISELTKGYQRHSDYSQKTRQLAQMAARIQSDFQAKAKTEIGGRAQKLDELAQSLEKAFLGETDLSSLSPEEFQQEYLYREKLKGLLKTAREEIEAEKKRVQQEEAQASEATLQYRATMARDLHPALADQGKLQAAWDVVAKTLTQVYGLSEQEVRSLSDPLHFAVALDAAKYRALKARGFERVKARKDTGPMKKNSGARQRKDDTPPAKRKPKNTGLVKARDRLMKLGASKNLGVPISSEETKEAGAAFFRELLR